MKRGEVWCVVFNNTIGEEIHKARPAVIVSNNRSNEILARVQVVPLTSNIEKCYLSEAIVVANKTKNKALAHQITTISKERLKSKIGIVSDDDMLGVERAIKVQLSIL